MEDINVSKKYTSLAKEIVKSLGGKSNIQDAYHCQTRLRFKLADETMVDDDQVRAIDGVLKVVRNAGVYQVVIGTNVADVFEEVEKFVDIKKDAGEAAPEEKKNVFETIIDFVAGVFQPVIPALSGAGITGIISCHERNHTRESDICIIKLICRRSFLFPATDLSIYNGTEIKM